MFGLDSWQNLAMMFEALFIIAVFYNFKEIIIERIYGVRFKRWTEIDTGRHGYTILNKSLNSCKIAGQTRTIHREFIIHGMIYFVADCCENLKLEDAKDKYQAYCQSEEFDTVLENKLLQQLLFIMEKNLIMIIIGLVVITLIVSGYGVYHATQQDATINYIAWRVNQTASTGGVINVP